MEWVCKDYLEAQEDEKESLSSESAPVDAVYITESDMSLVTLMLLSSTVKANATIIECSGIANKGALACNFRKSNVDATNVICKMANQLVDTPNAPVPCWAELFGLSGRGGSAEVALTLILPAHDSMVCQFQYDGCERMTWRALESEVSVLCAFTPSSKWFMPRITGKMAVWLGEEMVGEVHLFKLTAKHITNKCFIINDKHENISGTADAPSGGVALLAVLLCALEGGSSTTKTVSALSWEGGRHEDELISVHSVQCII